MDILILILAEVAFIEFLIIIALLWVLRRKAKKPEEKPVKPVKEVKPIKPIIVKSQKKPFKFKGLITIAILIPILIVGYIIYANFLASHDFVYIYDIGSEKDNYLSPIARISDKVAEEDVNYRNLTSGLVYFDVPIPANSDTITIETRFRNYFPNNTKVSIGASDNSTEWHYKYNNIFDSKDADFKIKGEWVIRETSFNIKENNLSIKNGKLSVLFNVPHLNTNQNETNKMYIPIDWIKVIVHKNGIFEKTGN